MVLTSPNIDWDLRTTDIDLVRNRISRLLRPFSLKADPRKAHDARLFGRQFQRTGIAIIEYGQEVDVDADPMQSFSLVQIPIRGSFELRNNGKFTIVHSNEAHLMGPVAPLHMHWSPDCRLLILRLNEWITRRLVAKCRPTFPELCSEAELGAVVPIDKGPGLSLFRIMCLMRDEALTNGSISTQRGNVSSVENLLLRLLGQTLEGSFKWRTQAGDQSTSGHLVERAKAFMSANLGRQISIDDVARACGVGQRTLFSGFQKSLQTGPKSWMTEKRLDKVREALSQRSANNSTVTEIALRWGFNHLGRFSAAYMRRFGEHPSETMRRTANG